MNEIQEKYNEQNLFNEIHSRESRNIKINDYIDDKIYIEDFEEPNKSKMLLDQIENLCSYTIFLINDIIEYSKIHKNENNKFEFQNRDSRAHENSKNLVSDEKHAKYQIDQNAFSNANGIKLNFNKRQSIFFINVNQEAVDLFEISKFCKDVTQTLLISKSKEKCVKLILNFEERIKTKIIKTDPFRLKQILLNNLSNSVKFTKLAFICIKIAILVCQKDKEEKVKISVIDTGIGINEQEIKLLFQDNVMLNSAKTYNETGSGLRLLFASV